MSKFDSDQIKAIANSDQNVVVLAGAGSGKTTSMLARVLRAMDSPLITRQLPANTPEENIQPENIYVASFTNIAAQTFRDRLGSLVGDSKVAAAVHISTLDTLATDIVRHVYPNASYDFSDYAIAKIVYDKLNIVDHNHYPDFIQFYKDLNYEPGWGRVNLIRKTYLDDQLENVAKYQLKQLRLNPKKNDIALTLPAIYTTAITIMVNRQFIPDIKLLVIDEVQDTSKDQFMFLEFLRRQLPDMKMITIGDVSQSMYRWHNARPENVTNYIAEFNATVLTLPNNYRSQSKIIDYANHFLAYNLDNIADIRLVAKTQRTPDIDEKTISPINFMSNSSEMINKIENLVYTHKVSPKDIAILARSNSELHKVQDDFKKNSGLPIFADRSKRSRITRYDTRIIRAMRPYVDILKLQPTQSNLSAFMKTIDSFTNSKTNYNPVRQSLAPYFRIAPATMPVNKRCAILSDGAKAACEGLSDKLHQLIFQPVQQPKTPSILLSTVHGVKGDQFKYVFYIPGKYRSLHMTKDYHNFDIHDPNREATWGADAETQNIHYVAITRAIDKLFIVDEELPTNANAVKTMSKEDREDICPEIRLLTADPDLLPNLPANAFPKTAIGPVGQNSPLTNQVQP